MWSGTDEWGNWAESWLQSLREGTWRGGRQTPHTEQTDTVQRIKPCVATPMALCLHSGARVNSWWVSTVELGSFCWKPPSIAGIILMREAGESARDPWHSACCAHSICIYFQWPDQPFSTNTWAFFVEPSQNPPPLGIYLLIFHCPFSVYKIWSKQSKPKSLPCWLEEIAVKVPEQLMQCKLVLSYTRAPHTKESISPATSDQKLRGQGCFLLPGRRPPQGLLVDVWS